MRVEPGLDAAQPRARTRVLTSRERTRERDQRVGELQLGARDAVAPELVGDPLDEAGGHACDKDVARDPHHGRGIVAHPVGVGAEQGDRKAADGKMNSTGRGPQRRATVVDDEVTVRDRALPPGRPAAHQVPAIAQDDFGRSSGFARRDVARRPQAGIRPGGRPARSRPRRARAQQTRARNSQSRGVVMLIGKNVVRGLPAPPALPGCSMSDARPTLLRRALPPPDALRCAPR